MNYSDDYVNSTAPFQGDETGEVFAIKEQEAIKLSPYERSFETQSGFLVLVKPVGSRFSLSFKRQIGTLPSSSISLTPDEAHRLANILKPNPNSEDEMDYAQDGRTAYINLVRPVRSKQSRVVEATVLILGTVLMCSVMVVIAYQLHHGQ